MHGIVECDRAGRTTGGWRRWGGLEDVTELGAGSGEGGAGGGGCGGG